MEEEILTSMKKLLGIPEDYTQFDMDITMHINTVFMILHQLGVGPEDGFSISYDEDTVWSDYITDADNLEAVKSYMFLKIKMLFDPPTGSTADAYNNLINELEWRLNVAVDPGSESEDDICGSTE